MDNESTLKYYFDIFFFKSNGIADCDGKINQLRD